MGRPFLRPYCQAGKPFPIELHETLALAAPRAIMHVTALNDFQYSKEETRLTRPVLERMAESVSAVFSLYGAADNYRQVLHEEGHGFAQAHRELAYAFLEEQLSAISH